MASYTFAVCVKCGVQSPPILEPRTMDKQLEKMGWKLDRMQFSVLATCPKCQTNADAT